LRRFKRHDVLVSAAARLHQRRDLHVIIAGEGSQRTAIEQQIRELGLTGRVRLLGHVDDIRPLLSCSDVVASSSGSHEGVPQSLVQALAMERPVVATDVGSVAELIVDEQTGLLVRPDDPAALAGAIECLLDHPALARSCGERGRGHVVAHYSHEQMIDRVAALYATLTAGAHDR
jgi:glycosyltransferase involved in cell wall biosynthesis